jgi:hypothetical protein
MSWISQFARTKPKAPDYAEKSLAAYKLGIKAGGAIEGIRILVGEDSCAFCNAHAGQTYSPEQAPNLPLEDCRHPKGCRCAYTLAMKPGGETVDWSQRHRNRG